MLNKKIVNYNTINQSGWNLSPQDSKGVEVCIEKALIGTSIEDTEHPFEIGRIFTISTHFNLLHAKAFPICYFNVLSSVTFSNHNLLIENFSIFI